MRVCADEFCHASVGTSSLSESPLPPGCSCLSLPGSCNAGIRIGRPAVGSVSVR